MGKRGPKAWEPTEEEIAKIKLYSGLGSTQEQVAVMVGKSVDTLSRNDAARKALDEGKAETIAKVAGSLVRKALGGDTASAIFYLKTQAGWREKSDLNLMSEDGSMTPRDTSAAVLEALKRKHNDAG
jgi:hypothetical protein